MAAVLEFTEVAGLWSWPSCHHPRSRMP